MYTTNMELFKAQQRELHRQAQEFRLTRSLLRPSRNGGRKSSPWTRMLSQPAQSSTQSNITAG